MTDKKQHGGARIGAGRKATGNVTIRVPIELVPAINEAKRNSSNSLNTVTQNQDKISTDDLLTIANYENELQKSRIAKLENLIIKVYESAKFKDQRAYY